MPTCRARPAGWHACSVRWVEPLQESDQTVDTYGVEDRLQLIRTRVRVAATIVAFLLVAAGGSATGASSSTVVGASVPSATFVDTAGCPPLAAGVTDLGVVMPGSSAITTLNCAVVFGSSNDTSMLRIAQQDGLGVGMWRFTDGDLDTTGFAAPNGYVNDPAAAFDTSQGRPMARMADGGVVIAGEYDAGGGNIHPGLLRLAPNGTVDGAFGAAAGIAFADVGVVSTLDEFGSVAVQDDGMIVAGGSYRDAAGDDRIVVARFTATGTLDTTGFGAPNGYVLIDTVDGGTGGDSVRVNDLAVDDSGRIVIVGRRGYAGGFRAILARVRANGTLDTTGCASPNGILDSISFGGSGNSYAGLAIAPDGASIYAVGEGTGSTSMLVARYDAACDLDTASFNAPNGYSTRQPGGVASQGYSIQLEDTGSVTLFGRSYQVGDTAALVARFDSNGLSDPSVGAGAGFVLVDTDDNGWFGETDEQMIDAMPLAHGGYLVVGTAYDGANYTSRVWWLTQSGALDTGYSGNGWHDLPLGVSPNPRAIVDSGDGRATIVGDTSHNGSAPARVARLGGEQVLDYGAGGTWGAGANVFGACLISVAAGAATDGSTWTVDPDGDCADGDADPWRAIPTAGALAAAKVAHAPSTDNDAEARLRFGFRASTSQRPGRYVAPISFEVVAPNA